MPSMSFCQPDGEEAPLCSSCPCQGCRLGYHFPSHSTTMSFPATQQPAISHLGGTRQPSSRQQTCDLNSLVHAITSCQGGGGGPSHPTTLGYRCGHFQSVRSCLARNMIFSARSRAPQLRFFVLSSDGLMKLCCPCALDLDTRARAPARAPARSTLSLVK
jgi:hypothetical protein